MMKVANFRNNIHFAFEHCTKHYHSCVGIREIENWLVIAHSKFETIDKMECRTAKAKDLDDLEEAKDYLIKHILKAKSRIELLKEEDQAQETRRNNVINLFQ